MNLPIENQTMNNNSLTDLLDWMRVKSRLFEWDMIVSLERTRYNRLLAQEYIRRFNTNAYLEPFNEEIPILDNKIFLHDFRFDRPRLSFENADLNDSKARLAMSVVGGQQVNLKKQAGRWLVQRLDYIGPLAGPELKLALRLGEVPGEVADKGEIKFDLSDSDDFELTFVEEGPGRAIAGDYFRELFLVLEENRRVWIAGQIAPGLEPLLTPQSFRLRTQAHPAKGAGEQGDGAVLGFIRMQGSYEGSVPTSGSDFNYLIPDGGDYSATVLLNSQRIVAAELLRQFRGLLRGAEFELHYSEGKVLEGITAVAGHWVTEFGTEHVTGRTGLVAGGREVVLELTYQVHIQPSPLKDNFRCVFKGNRVELEWRIKSVAMVELKKLEDTHGVFKPGDEDDYTDLDRPLEWLVTAVYEIAVGNDAELQLQSLEIVDLSPEVEPPEKEPLLNAGSDDPGPWVMLFLALWYVFFVHVSVLGMGDKQQKAIRQRLAKDIPTDLLTEELVHETVRLSFNNAITDGELYAPRDIGMFGKVDPRLTAFELEPLELIVTAGSAARQFTSGLDDTKLNWSVESAEQPNAFPGEILFGRYTPPSVIDGDWLRVRVCATDEVTRITSSALVTVVAQPVSLSPLIEVIGLGETAALHAGVLEARSLQWRIIGNAPHGRLASTSGTSNTYHAGPAIPGKAFIIEQVEVADTTITQSMWVITRMAHSANIVVDQVDLHRGELRMHLEIQGNQPPDNVTWTKAVGPGTVDKLTGVYRVDPAGVGRVAVIEGIYDLGFMQFSDFIIVPLPLHNFQGEMQVVCADVRAIETGQG